MNKMQIFNNPEFGEIRTLEIEGKAYAAATDVARALGYSNPHDAVMRHCKGVVKHEGVSTTTNQHGKSTKQRLTMNFIPEGDLYRLIVHSQLPAAERFEHWVFDEVLPTIRKTGKYETPKRRQSLGEVNSAARIIAKELKEAGMPPEFRVVALQSLYEPVGVKIPLDGITLPQHYYDSTAIAELLGIYSGAGKPHNKAVSAIIAQLFILDDEKTTVPFQNKRSGHSGTNTQYAQSVIDKITNWLEAHQYPAEIYHNDQRYKLYYKAKQSA